LVGLIFAVSMTTIDQTIVALSAPTIANDLQLTHDAIQWAVNVYLLAAAGLFIVGGRLSDLFGHRRLALVGIAGFALTSLLCGLAPAGDLAECWLVAARALQGASGALLVPAAVGIVVQSYDVSRRGRAMAIFFAITGAMTAIGPIAGGYLTEWTWRAIFFVNLPIAGAAFVLVAVTASRSTRTTGRIDLPGAVLITAGMVLLILGLEQSSEWGWGSPVLWVVLGAGAIAVVGFIAWEAHARDPLVRLQAFARPGFSIAIAASLVASIAFVPTFFFLSVYGQVSLRQSALQTGLLFLKFFLGFVIASRFGSVMFDKRGAKPVLLLGGAIGAVGFGLLGAQVSRLDFDAGQFFNAQTLPIALAGAGIGFLYSPVSTDAVNRAIGASYGEVTALSQSARSFGGALGLALFGPLVTSAFTDALVTSFHRLGLPTAAARTASESVSGATGQAQSQLSGLPESLANSIRAAVAQDYASGVRIAFVGMAAAMIVLIALGIVYPRAQRAHVPASAGSAPGRGATEPEGSVP
jgi:EmrB/QacA subfamily drug resistance transporter